MICGSYLKIVFPETVCIFLILVREMMSCVFQANGSNETVCIFIGGMCVNHTLAIYLSFFSLFLCLALLTEFDTEVFHVFGCFMQMSLSWSDKLTVLQSPCSYASVREQISGTGVSSLRVNPYPGWGSMCRFPLLSKKKPMIIILLLNRGRVCVWVGEITIFWWRGLCLTALV